MNNNKDVYVYEYKGGLYINPTNQCSNSCIFCLRNNKEGVGEHKLWINEEPTAERIIEDMKKYPKYKSIVFCGFGEPMYKLEVLKKVCTFAKQKGMSVKVNTNGHSNKIHERNVLPELKGLVDTFSISLNADNKFDYQKECACKYGEDGFDYMLEFAKKSVENGFETILSVVDFLPKETIDNCEKIARDIGAKLRVRHMVG